MMDPVVFWHPTLPPPLPAVFQPLLFGLFSFSSRLLRLLYTSNSAGLHQGSSDWHSMGLTMTCNSYCIFVCLNHLTTEYNLCWQFLFVEREHSTSALPWAQHRKGLPVCHLLDNSYNNVNPLFQPFVAVDAEQILDTESFIISMIRPFFCAGRVFLNAAQVDSLIKSILIKQLVLWIYWHRLQAATCLFSPTPSTLRKHRIKVRTSSDSWSRRMWMWKSRERGRRLTSSSQERRFNSYNRIFQFPIDHSVPLIAFQGFLCIAYLCSLWYIFEKVLMICFQSVSNSFHCW